MRTRVENEVDFCAGSSMLFNLTTWHHHACILYWQGTKAPGWQTTWEFLVSWCCLSTFYIPHQQCSASCIGWCFLVFFFKQISGHNIPKKSLCQLGGILSPWMENIRQRLMHSCQLYRPSWQRICHDHKNIVLRGKECANPKDVVLNVETLLWNWRTSSWCLPCCSCML